MIFHSFTVKTAVTNSTNSCVFREMVSTISHIVHIFYFLNNDLSHLMFHIKEKRQDKLKLNKIVGPSAIA